jgi:hypothetical protein
MKKTVFEEMVDRAFWGLEAKYAFKKIETRYVDRTCTVRFRNATTEVLLNYEIGHMPWLDIFDLKNEESKSTLGWLLVELGKADAPKPDQAFQPAVLKNEALEPTLKKMGQQLLDYGGDLLKGDFAILPKLQARARKYDQDIKRYLAAHGS